MWQGTHSFSSEYCAAGTFKHLMGRFSRLSVIAYIKISISFDFMNFSVVLDLHVSFTYCNIEIAS